MLKELIAFVFITFCHVQSLLVRPQERCIPTSNVKGPCHTCVCNGDGIFICHATTCTKTKASKVGFDFNDLPDIAEGESCIPGNLYKMSCNTCQCGEKNALMCTKMACFENALLKTKSRAKDNKELLRNRPKKTSGKKKKLSNKDYPPLPKGTCDPGRIYRKGCKKCFCNERSQAVCTKTCSSGFPNRFSDKEISEMETRPLLDLPELKHMGMKCDPGRTYYVLCNICFCTHKHDLFCTTKYCINMATYADVHSKELSGRPCKKDFKLLCTQCKCVDKKNVCEPIPNCGKNMSGKQLLSSAAGADVKLTLDINKDKCKPNVTYKYHCNECYCQPEGSLRCTQKICLTYSQTKDLQDVQTHLEKYGL